MAEDGQPEVWITAAQRGDRMALAKLLATCHPALRARADGHMEAAVKTVRTPDDILQDVYLNVARQIEQFENRGPGSFLNWVRAILDHKLIDARRAAHCQAHDINREVPIGGAAGDSYWDLLDCVLAESGTPSHVARRQEALDAMLMSLSDLSEAHRQVIQLRFLEGLPVSEAAGRLGKSEDAVVALTRRALEALRRSMDRLGEFTRGV